MGRAGDGFSSVTTKPPPPVHIRLLFCIIFSLICSCSSRFVGVKIRLFLLLSSGNLDKSWFFPFLGSDFRAKVGLLGTLRALRRCCSGSSGESGFVVVVIEVTRIGIGNHIQALIFLGGLKIGT